MANLILPRRFTQQPQGAERCAIPSYLDSAGGDYTSPAYGANFANGTGGGPASRLFSDQLSYNPPALINGVLSGGSLVSTPFGRGIRPNTGSSGGWEIPPFGPARSGYPAWQSLGDFTAGLVFSRDSTTMDSASEQTIFGQGEFVNNDILVYISPTGWGEPRCTIRVSNGTTSVGLSFPDLEVNKLHTLFFGKANGVVWAILNGNYQENSIAAGGTWSSANCYLGGHPRKNVEQAFRGVFYNLFMLPNALLKAELRNLSEPWQIFRKHPQVLYFDTAGGGATTGTLAATETGNDTASLSGAVLVSGALSATESGSDTAALTGNVVVSGSLAVTESGADTAAFTGSASVTITGSLAATESGTDTAAITGTVLVSGSLDATETGADTAFFNGSSVIIATGTLSATETGTDTAALTGSVLVEGSLAASETGADTATVTGNILIDGYLAATETGADTAFFNGSSAIISTGTLAATETGSDTAAITGKLIVTGQVTASESGQDSAAMTGTVLVLGALGAFEVDVDTASVTGKVYISGSMAAQETGNDTAGFFSASLRAVEMLTALERNTTLTALERDTLLESRNAIHG